ncbi:MAG: bifunctional aldolase/short-chain dehydrogenase [Gemmatimonadota bacterium]|nr:MAG: bifunctional aldolase/short-chain dehydrogenase [Gemmatimonadota bacterium]
MKNKWNEDAAGTLIATVDGQRQPDLSHRIYSARLIGSEPDLVLHGGGNVSVKTSLTDVFGAVERVIYVKASGQDMREIGQEGFVALDQDYLARLAALESLSDEAMKRELSLHLARPHGSLPSIEALMHVFLPPKFIDHTHPAAVLALTNRKDAERLIVEALGEKVATISYVKPGFELAAAAARAFASHSECDGLVLMHHGLITWGATAREAYDRTIELVSRAEQCLKARRTGRALVGQTAIGLQKAVERYRAVAPVLRGSLIVRDDHSSLPARRVILRPLLDEDALWFLESDNGRELALSPPLTPDNLIRTGVRPLWVDGVDVVGTADLKSRLVAEIERFSRDYTDYLRRHAAAPGHATDTLPKVVMLPGVGIVCAGRDVREADIARDIMAQTIDVKTAIVETGGTYDGLSEDYLFAMEYDTFQQAKLRCQAGLLPIGTVALVTGSAGAIGSGICEALLEAGAHVAVTDLPGPGLDSLAADMREVHGDRVVGVPLDVCSDAGVAEAFAAVVDTWGGIDLIVMNAGLAHVSSLADMELRDFQRLEAVNVEGTLVLLRAAARLFAGQGAGGDVVLVSTKNVFAPGAGFGAYSATKAAGHQLARIASLELAELDVRVNMVAPDAVFSHGERRSGLWAEVGPARMQARGLDEEGLEEYYRNRNLLKVRVSASDVARAVLFFATRQTPTTGATIPVDGGLPDSTPR